jgi:hypothetical protein
LKVEQRCLDFLRQRIQSAQMNASKLKFEIARYEELGMSHVVKECASSAAKLTANITEDLNALAALGRDAAGTVDSLRRAGAVDDDAVPLHPAEVVLHHRIRAVAAAAGVLLPAGADLSKEDFLSIPTGSVFRCCVGGATLVLTVHCVCAQLMRMLCGRSQRSPLVMTTRCCRKCWPQ